MGFFGNHTPRSGLDRFVFSDLQRSVWNKKNRSGNLRVVVAAVILNLLPFHTESQKGGVEEEEVDAKVAS